MNNWKVRFWNFSADALGLTLTIVSALLIWSICCTAKQGVSHEDLYFDGHHVTDVTGTPYQRLDDKTKWKFRDNGEILAGRKEQEAQ